MINKLLIANRGEIACRIIKTAKKLGIRTTAIYSDIDKYSRHVQMADEAFHVGPNPSAQSYLQASKIIDIALHSKCSAIHPGFGFLSENGQFADDCHQNNIIFVGPPSKAIELMGSKSESKHIMSQANVPIVPGYHGNNQDPNYLFEESKKIGYPLMIKAVMGGGGKGMRVVMKEEDFFSSLESAKRESLKSFKDDRVIIERYIQKPRHIEIQIFGDYFKNYVYLFERDCSIQRRHQKVIEEAPSNITPQLREQIGNSAISAARAVNYHNAGTVEFIFDTETNEYFFMEMNTRLQVEHPVTEIITRQDLVEWQLKVASGFPLPLKQEDLKIHGQGIEARIYAEDPFNGFLPASGDLKVLREPHQEEGVVRIDSGVVEKDSISIFYDPMISKLIVWGKDRQEAVQKMKLALRQYKIGGLPTNIRFLKNLCNNKIFQRGIYDTGFIEQNQEQLLNQKEGPEKIDVLTAVIGQVILEEQDIKNSQLPKDFFNMRMGYDLQKKFLFKVNGANLKQQIQVETELTYHKDSTYSLSISSENEEVYRYEKIKFQSNEKNTIVVETEQGIFNREIYFDDKTIYTFDEEGDPLQFLCLNDKMPEIKVADSGVQQKIVKSPMSGTLLKTLVQSGDEVKKGTLLFILEAMKMEHNIKAASDGKVKQVFFKEGSFVEHGAIVVEFE